MIKSKLILILVFLGFSASAQFELWGTTEYGAQRDAGGIYRYSSLHDSVYLEYSFPFAFGRNPGYSVFVEDQSGYIYSTTRYGGEHWGGEYYTGTKSKQVSMKHYGILVLSMMEDIRPLGFS